jgi:molybdenum cofactor cytidylyltransferase
LTRIAAIVLAAGRSSRFEHGNKLSAKIDGVPLVRRVLTAVEASAVTDILLIVAPEAHEILEAAGAGRWRTVVNTQFEQGLASSIRAGVAALPETTDGALVVLADMPEISTHLIARIIDANSEYGGGVIVYPASEKGRQGHPVLWPRRLFPELALLEGDTGGKILLQKHKGMSRPVLVTGNSPFLDIDTNADLARYKAR